MTTASNKVIYLQVIEQINQNKPNGLDNLIAPDVIDHNPIPQQASGLEGIKQWAGSMRSAFGDLRGTVEEVGAENDRVVGRVTWSGTHQGEFQGVKPTGRPVRFAAIHIVRLDGDRIAEWWGLADIPGLMQQITAPNDPTDTITTM